MIDLQKLKESIERAAAAATEKHLAALQQSLQEAVTNSAAGLKKAIIKQVMAELEPELATPPGGAPTDLLNAAVASIQDANTQSDILGALLAGVEKFSQRCGLLVVRANQAAGWQSKGLDADAFRALKVDVGKGLSERAIRTRGPVAGTVGEFDATFVDQFGAPADGNVILLPLVVRDRVAALLFADGGAEGSSGLDASGVEVLVRTTDLWLEVISARKVAEQHSGAAAAANDSGSMTAAEEVSAAASAPTVKIPATPEPEPAPEPAPVKAAASAPVEMDDIHKKAKRFAKLLVDEIKLYNQTKVTEGRQNKDIYDRLKEDIEKSRQAYTKRFGEAVTDVDFFTNELVRILAENDRSAMGGNFPA